MQTDSDLGPQFLIYTRNAAGNIMSGAYPSVPPTTAGKFAVGCKVVDSTGIAYYNRGTVAAPVWESQPLQATVTLSAAQIIAMYTTPVVVIPAVGNKTIVLDSFVFDLTGTATQFTGGGVVNLQYDSTANGAGTTLHNDIAAAVVTGATARSISIRPAKDLSSLVGTAVNGVGVYISNKTGVFATGTGTAVLKVSYHLI